MVRRTPNLTIIELADQVHKCEGDIYAECDRYCTNLHNFIILTPRDAEVQR